MYLSPCPEKRCFFRRLLSCWLFSSGSYAYQRSFNNYQLKRPRRFFSKRRGTYLICFADASRYCLPFLFAEKGFPRFRKGEICGPWQGRFSFSESNRPGCSGADWVYFKALAHPEALIVILSVLRRCSVLVGLFVGGILFKDVNKRKKSWVLLGIMIGVLLIILAG
jgi:hypothetical protein